MTFHVISCDVSKSVHNETVVKIMCEISKSFDFIEIILISNDFSDFKNDFRLQKSIKCVGDLTKFFHMGAYQLEILFIRRLLIKVVKYAVIYEIFRIILA